MTQRDIDRLEHAARIAFGFDERAYVKVRNGFTWVLSVALTVALVALVVRAG